MNPSLVMQVEAIKEARGWSCLSPVVNGVGVWALLQWRCAAGHQWAASLYTAERFGCPVCRTRATRERVEAEAAQTEVSIWCDVTPALPPSQGQVPIPKSTSIQHRRKNQRAKVRPRRFNGVIT